MKTGKDEAPKNKGILNLSFLQEVGRILITDDQNNREEIITDGASDSSVGSSPRSVSLSTSTY